MNRNRHYPNEPLAAKIQILSEGIEYLKTHEWNGKEFGYFKNCPVRLFDGENLPESDGKKCEPFSVCASGALRVPILLKGYSVLDEREAEKARKLLFNVHDDLNELIRQKYPDRKAFDSKQVWSVVNFNDHPDTLKEEVVELMEQQLEIYLNQQKKVGK